MHILCLFINILFIIIHVSPANAQRRPTKQELFMSMGDLIKELRTERGLSQQELSKFSNVPFTTINKLENGKANVTIDTLERILAVFSYELTGKKKASNNKSDLKELN